MKYTIDKKEQYVVFSPLEEKIDSLLAPKLKSELLTIHAEGYSNLVLDMSQVQYVDSSGLSALLVGDREFGRNGEAGEMVFMHEIDGGEDEEGA
jgi:anti-anti-sigma factor